MRAQFRFPPLPRHPLLRALALAGIVVTFVGLLAVGLAAGAVAIAIAALGLAIRRWRAGPTTRPVDPSVIEGEFTVVQPRTRAGLPRPE